MSTAELDTKQNWDDCHFDQHPTHSIHLSGCTVICGQLKICSPTGFTASVGAGSGKIWTSDASGIGTWQNPIESVNLTKLVCQVSHGFNVNDVLGFSGGTYNKPVADGTYNGEVLGIVSYCYNANCFDLTQGGYVTGLTGLIGSCTYFLSEVTPGLLTTTETCTVGHIDKSVLIATSSTSGWVLPYPGYIISSGSSGGGGGTITGATNGLGVTTKNICLGGTIISPTLICSTIDANTLTFCTITSNSQCSNKTTIGTGTFSTCSNDSTLPWSTSVNLGGAQLSMVATNSSTCCNQITLRPDMAIFTSIGAGNSGFQYASDYSTKFNACDRTIPDVGWVKGRISGTALHIPVFNGAGNNISGSTLTFNNNTLSNSDNLTISAGNNKVMCLVAKTGSNNLFYLGTATQTGVTGNQITAIGTCPDINVIIFPKGNGGFYSVAPFSYIGPAGPGCNGFYVRSNTFELASSVRICGTLGEPDACPICILGSMGCGINGFSGCGGDVYICGGCAQGGVSKTGGTVTISAGAGIVGGARGNIKFINLPSKSSETCAIYIDSAGKISTGTVAGSGINWAGSSANGVGIYVSSSCICSCSNLCFDGSVLCTIGCVNASSTMTATNFILSSDERLKSCITSISLAPVDIEYKQFELVSEPNQLRYGVIAQDLQKTNPELVRVDENGILTVAYIDLLVKEVAYLKCKIIELENKIG